MNSAPSQTKLDMTSVPFNHNGTQLNLSFTWGVFETLQNEWGGEYQAKLNALFVHGDVTNFRYVAMLASGVSFDEDTVIPVQKLINDLYRAYELGWSGRVIKAAPEASESTGKKPSLFAKFSTIISTYGSRLGSRGKSSLS